MQVEPHDEGPELNPKLNRRPAPPDSVLTVGAGDIEKLAPMLVSE